MARARRIVEVSRKTRSLKTAALQKNRRALATPVLIYKDKSELGRFVFFIALVLAYNGPIVGRSGPTPGNKGENRG